MRSSITKILSFVVIFAMLLSVLCFGSGVSALAASQNVIRIIVDGETFGDYQKVYCMIYDETADGDVTSWMSKNAQMTREGDSETWSYDLDAHEITLDPAHCYTVSFVTDTSTTDELVIDGYDASKDYTAVFSELYTYQSFTEFPKYLYKWIGENEFDVGMDIIRINTDTCPFWKPIKNLYCRIVDETANEETIEMGRMTQEAYPDVWSFDLGKHGAALNPEHTYSVVFHDGRGQTEPLMIDNYDRSVDYTAHYTGKNVVWSADYSFIYGDADCDGEVTILDATVIQRILVNMDWENFNVKAADVDGEGLDIIDATLIQRYLVNMIERFPAEAQTT